MVRHCRESHIEMWSKDLCFYLDTMDMTVSLSIAITEA